MILFWHGIHFIYNPDAIVHNLEKGDFMPVSTQCNSQNAFEILKDKSVILSYADLMQLGVETMEDLQGIPNTISKVARRQLEINKKTQTEIN